jgi:CheY-like chemotaxis protein
LSLVQTIKQDADLMTIRLVLLTDSTGHEQGKRALQSGFSAYLTRPVRHAALFEAVSDALADQPQRYPLVMGDFSEPILTDKPAPENQHHLPILLAEDNPVSERIALKQLEKLGCNVHTVSNGREVLTAMSRSSTGYALILMDCQMPEMDGFEATQAIRESELHTGRHIPIIAMTANAMPDDRDICLAIGMDDYISKPVSLETMRMVIDRWMLSPQQKS